MDPTKPILDLYGQSFYSVKQSRPQQPHYKTQPQPAYNQNPPTNPNQSHHSYNPKYNTTSGGDHYQKRKGGYESSFAQLQDKYQELYQAYKDKSSKLSLYETENDQLKNQNSRLRNQIDRLNGKNQQLNSVLIEKNMELEDAYRKLQDQIRVGGGSRIKGNDLAIDRLQDGLKQAITSNFQILRQSALSQLKHFLH